MPTIRSPIYGGGGEWEAEVPVSRHDTGGSFHDFLLLSAAEYPMEDYEPAFTRFHEAPRAFPRVSVHDDVLRAMHDALSWIPARLPNREQTPHQGLCYWGPTLITAEGAPVARRVFGALSDLYAAAPERVRLRGDYQFDDEGREGYRVLIVSRGDLLHALDTLAHFASEVATSRGARYILHLGI